MALSFYIPPNQHRASVHKRRRPCTIFKHQTWETTTLTTDWRYQFSILDNMNHKQSKITAVHDGTVAPTSRLGKNK